MTTNSQDDAGLTGFDTNDDLDAFAKEFLTGKATAKPEEKAPAQEVEEPVEEAEDLEVDETVEDADVPEETDSEEAPVEEKPKKKTAQDRIKELTAKNYDIERARAADKAANDARIADLERKLQELSSKETPTPGTLPDGAPDPLAEDEGGNLKYALGEFDPAYIRDLAKFTIKQEQDAAQAYRKQAEEQQAVEAARTEARAKWNEKLEETHAEMPDVVDKIASLDAVVADVDMGYQQYLVDVIMSLDNGPRVMAYLADNPEMARKIVMSGASSATVALGRLDGKMAKPPVEKKVVTKAPKPAARITRGTSGQFTTRGDTDDLDAFARDFFRK